MVIQFLGSQAARTKFLSARNHAWLDYGLHAGPLLRMLLLLLQLSRFSRVRPCATPCDPIDGSPPGSAVHGILQARALEGGAIAFSDYSVWLTVNLLSLQLGRQLVSCKCSSRTSPDWLFWRSRVDFSPANSHSHTCQIAPCNPPGLWHLQMPKP